MKYITLLLAGAIVLSACTDESSESPVIDERKITEDPLPPAVSTPIPTTEVEFDNFTITAPKYTFLHKPFTYSVNDSEGIVIRNGVLGHHSGFAPAECCEQAAFVHGKFHYFPIPTYNNVLYLGSPITIKANSKQVIGATLDYDFLTDNADAIKSITWHQTAGSVAYTLSPDNVSLSFTTPNVSHIERWVFSATVRTEQDRVFTEDKVVFVAPETAWLDVLQIYVSSGNDIAALRSDQTIYAYANNSSGIHTFFDAPVDNIDHVVASTTDFIFLITSTGDIFYRSTNGANWEKREQNIGRVKYVIDAASARQSVIFINESGDVYDTLSDFKLRAQGAVSIVADINENIILNEEGYVVYLQEDEVLLRNINQMHSMGFITNEGKVGTLYPSPELSVFDAYDDYTFVTTTKAADHQLNPSLSHHLFALRANGDVVSTSRLPPLLENIKSISTGAGIHAALAENGTVHVWGLIRVNNEKYPAYASGLNDKNTFLNGKLPSPINLTESAFNAYRALVED